MQVKRGLGKHVLNKQRGFFDFGIGLGLMLLFGGAAVVSSPESQQQSTIAAASSVEGAQVQQQSVKNEKEK